MIRGSILIALIAGGLSSAATVPGSFHRLLVFEPNRGQAPAQVKWLGQGSRYQVLVGGEGATIVIPDKSQVQSDSARLPGVPPPLQLPYSAVRMKLVGGRPWNEISGAEPTGGVSNYRNASDLHHSINRIPQYGRVRVANVYQGIDLIFYTNGGDLEYDFVVAPGADPEQIQVVFEGAQRTRIDRQSGDLVVTLPGGSQVRQLKPKVYQQAGKQRIEIAAGYRMLEKERAAFTLSGYDPSRQLVIDPRLTIARSIGGTKDDQANAIAVDNQGNSFITGFTYSMNFPATNNTQFSNPKSCGSFPFDNGFCGSAVSSNAFVAEIASDGSIPFVTYDGVGFGNGIAVDSSGIYVTGQAFQPDGDVNDFPFDNNNGELFVQRLAINGVPGYFTFADESGIDFGNAIALDDLHNAWAVGGSYPGGTAPPVHALVVEVAPNGQRIYKRRFSSTGDDIALGVAVAARQPWITGKTCGDGFPVTGGEFRLGPCSVFVLHLDEAGNQMMGTIFGSDNGNDAGVAIVTNGSEDVFVTGYTTSAFFPTTLGSFQDAKTFAGRDGFVAAVTEVTNAGALVGRIVHATLLEADGDTTPYGIANDNAGGVFVAGTTAGRSFPGATSAAPSTATIGFVSKISFDMTQLRYSVLLGRALTGVAVRDPLPVFPPQAACGQCLPEIYVAGWQDQVFEQDGSGLDAFMVKMVEDSPTSFATTAARQSATPSFTVSWGGSSPVSGIASYDVFVSDNGGPFTPFQTATTATSATFTGLPGHTYGFFSIATDAAGNKEPMKTAPDVVVTVGPAPPTILCTGCYFLIGSTRATLAFNVSATGSNSTFAFNFRSATQAVQFASTTTSQIFVNGNSATFAGQGNLNGQTGYSFTVTAQDGGVAGSGLDTVSIAITGPNNFSYAATGTIAGGDIVVHQ